MSVGPVKLWLWCPRGHYLKLASGARPGQPLLRGEIETAGRLFDAMVLGASCPACKAKKAQP